MSHRPLSLLNTEAALPQRQIGALAMVLVLALAGVSGTSVGATHAWLVAGEPDSQSIQPRSEATALWVSDTVRSVSTGAVLQTLLADPTPELFDRSGQRLVDGATPLQPLARVFGQQAFNAGPTRRLRISAAVVGARADMVSAALDKEFATLRPTDRGLFFYAGPGQADPSDAAGNTLRLWDNSALSVRELDALSSHAPITAPMRFVLTQCHSSGFQRLIRPSARDQRNLGRHNRCAFTSEPIDHLSHRCPVAPADTEAGEDRDYASQFFSALAGRTRAGMPLRRSPDLDGDHTVTLHEAHLHAIVEGDGIDLPRSSTETYLERWQPMWLRYLDTVSEPDNEYGRVAQALAERLHLPLRGRALVDALETRQKELTARLQRLADESQRAGTDIDRLQTTLRRALTQRWPAAAHPHTAGYARFLANDLGAAQAFVLSQIATYPALVARQERQAQIVQDRLALDRSLTQLDKLMRLRELARLRVQFDRHATEQARQELERLTRCENTPL
ncbi:MAG: hypothetical protein RL260_3234 [Pseudomonadota bacterium]|jgi:hypothetical protein